MKKLLILFTLIVTFSSVVMAQRSDMLTNEGIVEMKSKGLPTSIIISKIKSSMNSFDVGTDALVDLVNRKVPEEIVNAMMEAANDPQKHFVKVDANNPLDFHDPGIYYHDKIANQLLQLEPTVYSQSKSGGALASAFTYGLAKVKASVTIDGKNSRRQIPEQQPEFYFYFDETKNTLSQTSNWWFSTATSPNEFLLVKLTIKPGNREVETASANVFGASSGVADKNKIYFKFEKVAQGIYRVFFDNPIAGEFCFMYAGTVPQGFTSLNKVYDFGVKGSVEEENIQLSDTITTKKSNKKSGGWKVAKSNREEQSYP